MLQSTNPTTNDRSTDTSGSIFIVTLTAKPGQDGIRALRGFLKLALRRFDLRCVDAREKDTYDGTDDFAKSIDLAYELIRERMANGGPGWTQKEYRPK